MRLASKLAALVITLVMLAAVWPGAAAAESTSQDVAYGVGSVNPLVTAPRRQKLALIGA